MYKKLLVLSLKIKISIFRNHSNVRFQKKVKLITTAVKSYQTIK